jgi:predicted Fe-Mo cluster-binding NifX family protein
VDSRFGRCAYFVIVDSETMKIKVFSNPASQATGGADPNAANEINKYKAEVLLTGEVGGNAQNVLKTAGIKIITGISGTVKEAVDHYLTAQQQE